MAKDKYNAYEDLTYTKDPQLMDLQKQKLQGDIDNQKWNSWLNGAGIAGGVFNGVMNYQNYRMNKKHFDKQNKLLTAQTNNMNDQVENRKAFRTKLATV